MAIEVAFETLRRTLELLKDELEELRVNATDFCPESTPPCKKNGGKSEEPPPPPVVTLADRATDLEGEIHEVLQEVKKAALAVKHPRRLAEARIALTSLERGFIRFLRRFLTEVATFDSLQTLGQMARKLGGGWPEWSVLIKAIIQDCQQRTLEVLPEIAECWQELADKLSTNSVSVQATNIGQQFAAPEQLARTVQEVT